MVTPMTWFAPQKELPGFQALTVWVSTGIHLFILLLFVWYTHNHTSSVSSESDLSTQQPVQWVDLQQWKKKQVVDVSDMASVTTQKVNSDLLGDQNRLVKKQTVAKGSSGQPTKPEPQNTSSKPIDKLNLSESALSQVLAQTMPSKTPHTVSFTPSNYLPDVQEGEQTLLSTQKFAYASFFNRMKHSIQGYWKPPMHTIAHAPRKSNWIAQVLIVLNENGGIVDMQVLQSSGSSQLDDFTLSAVQKASPFPNPPSVLMDEYGEIRMTWNFIFSQGDRF